MIEITECCVDDAWIEAIRGLDCTPVAAADHFVLVRPDNSKVPYVVISTATSAGLRTSDFVERISTTRIAGYFDKDKIASARQWSELLTAFLASSGCLSLGNCGCFCVRSQSQISMVIATELILVSVSVTGKFTPASGSGSE